MSSIPISQTTDMVRRNIITPEAVWEEISTIEDSWLHSAGWLIRVIKRTRRRMDVDDNVVNSWDIKVFVHNYMTS